MTLDIGPIDPGERQHWMPRDPSPDCVICSPMSHLDCTCDRRCKLHADAAPIRKLGGET